MAFVNKLNDAVRIVQDLEYEYESVIDTKNEEIDELEKKVAELESKVEALEDKLYDYQYQLNNKD